MGSTGSAIGTVAILVVFVYENATSMLVAGFICWFIGRMGSVNMAVPRTLPQVLHAVAATLFVTVGAGFMLISVLRNDLVSVAVAAICIYYSIRNFRQMFRVPIRVRGGEVFFDGPPPPAPKGSVSGSDDEVS